ncbi:hypothetical protein C8J56DRAFT_954369 [Mycena floridula]|nr:hypothetical protein C8J56DRAFT_954369 [Mycena floridula]
MSLRIKLPGRAVADNSQPKSEGRRRQSNKRRVLSDDEEPSEEEAGPAKKKPRIDEEDDIFADEAEEYGASRIQKSSKRLRKAVGDYEAEEENDSEPLLSDYDDDEEEKPRLGQGSKAKRAKGSGKSKSGNTQEIFAKDERKLVPPSKRAKTLSSKLEDAVVAPNTSTLSSPANGPAQREDSSPPQKRRKLPTIKKIKSQTPSTPSNSTVKPPAPATTKVDSALPPIPASGSARPLASNIGVADFDLRNKNVYEQLMFTQGPPRSGQKDDRRKELNKMREEYKAKRTQEAKPPFDLQDQMDRILRYEEQLRRMPNGGAVLYPNILGSKWKDEYERKRRRPQPAASEPRGDSNSLSRAASENIQPTESAVDDSNKEEGEV